ncbi:MAG: DUF6036 family nucleotidyltransferase [Chloroflexi bacterium]|nr:DUF6036 family nucleotidyltransferase [Chloroflexota bacterium]
MENITSRALTDFFERLGDLVSFPTTLYLLGGSAMHLLGSPRETLDIDYALGSAPADIQKTIDQLASDLKLDLELAPLGEFIPLPPEAETRRRLIGRYGLLEVYLFDLYSIALSKIARGFESDLDDVEYLLRQEQIAWDELESHFNTILPRAASADIDPREFQQYFETLRKRVTGQ